MNHSYVYCSVRVVKENREETAADELGRIIIKYENMSSLILNHCCDVTLLLKELILFKESTVIQLILKIIHTVDS